MNQTLEKEPLLESDEVRAPELIARFARLVSPPTRTLFGQTMLLALGSGTIRGIALVALLPASIALSSSGTSWGISLTGWLWMFAVLAVVGGVVEYILSIINYQVALDLIRNVQNRIGNRMARLPLGWFRPAAAGRLSRLVSREVMMVGETLAHMLATGAALAASAVVMVLGGWLWDWRLGLVLTVACPIYVVMLAIGQVCITRGKRISEPAEEELGDRIVEFARCQGALRSSGHSADFAPLRNANAAALFAGRRDLWWGLLANMLHGIAGQLVVVTLITLAAQLATGGSLGPIETIAFIGISLRFMQTLEDLGGIAMGVEERRVVVDSINDVLTAPVLPEPKKSAQLATPGSLELDDVHFGYLHDTPVLSGVSLAVAPGQMCAIVGPSGAGKTTIAKLVARFYDTSSGTVRVGGVDVRDQTTSDLMQQLSMVFQDVYLFDDTLEANIRVGNATATEAEVREAASLAGVTEIAERLPAGWATRVGEGGNALSGGEKQRVSIARALIKHASIVLLDEATSALDPENEANVLASVNHLRKEATLLVIAHKLDTIETADEIIVLGSDGTVVQQGTHNELIDVAGQYQDFCNARRQAQGWRLA